MTSSVLYQELLRSCCSSLNTEIPSSLASLQVRHDRTGEEVEVDRKEVKTYREEHIKRWKSVRRKYVNCSGPFGSNLTYTCTCIYVLCITEICFNLEFALPLRIFPTSKLYSRCSICFDLAAGSAQ